MKNNTKSLNAQAEQEMLDWPTRGIQSRVRLMTDYLRLSPTYELARKFRNSDLSSAEKKLLPADFDLVLKTYDDFGDVNQRSFDSWWQSTGISLYGSEFVKPSVRKIAGIEQDQAYGSEFSRALVQYFKTDRAHEGNGPTLILAVPLGMKKQQALREIAKLIDDAGVIAAPIGVKKLARPDEAERFRLDPLIRGYYLLRSRATESKLELWRLGVMYKISPKNAKGLDINAKRLSSHTADQRIRMASLTSRALRKAQYVCENAARGKFLCSDSIELPEFDYEDIGRRFKTYWVRYLRK